MSELIEFYSGNRADHRGRAIDEIIAGDDDRLEQTHDYIQWLFPLAEPSRFNPDAPLLTDSDRVQFQRRPELRAKMLTALARMLEFYGFSWEGQFDVEQSTPLFTPPRGHHRHWLSPGNHNYLRITRILTSLGLVGLRPWAVAFFQALSQLYPEHAAVIGADTLAYWRRAIAG